MIIDHAHDTEKDIHIYHLGFHNSKMYLEFYDWLRGRKIHYDYTDMPHHYFVLLNEDDRLEMHKRFSTFIKEDARMLEDLGVEDLHDLTAPPDDSEEYILLKLLHETIAEEIIRSAQQIKGIK